MMKPTTAIPGLVLQRVTALAILCCAGASLSSAGCATAPLRPDPVYFPPPPAAAHAVHLKSFNSLADLVPLETSWLDVLRGRVASPYVGVPAGLAFHGDCLYVCDTDINAVHKWDLAAGRARRIGDGGSVTLETPVDVAVDQGGVVYVADTGRSEVVAFDAGGEVLRKFKPDDREAYRPVAVAVHGSRLFVADIASHRIDVFSTTDAKQLGSFGQAGSEPGTFYYPMGLATDGRGNVLVCDLMNARVQVFDPNWTHSLSFGQPGNRYGDLGKPKRLAVGPDGTIFVADAEFARVHLFDGQGRLLMLLGADRDGPGGTMMPSGLAVAPTVPPRLTAAVPQGFNADYFLFVANTVGSKRISLYAVGTGR